MIDLNRENRHFVNMKHMNVYTYVFVNIHECFCMDEEAKGFLAQEQGERKS